MARPKSEPKAPKIDATTVYRCLHSVITSNEKGDRVEHPVGTEIMLGLDDAKVMLKQGSVEIVDGD